MLLTLYHLFPRRSLLAFLLSVPIGLSAQHGTFGTVGKTFWLTYTEGAGGTIDATLMVSGASGTAVTVSLPRTTWAQTSSIPVSGVILIPLPDHVEHQGSGTTKNNGVRVVANAPISVTAITGTVYSSEATVVLPEGALGTQYQVTNYPAVTGWTDSYKSSIGIVATRDATRIRITPSANTAHGVPAGTAFTITLDAGQTYQVQGVNTTADLSGTLVEATDDSGPCKPFAVFSGNSCAFIPQNCQSCNPLYDQALPVAHWGTEYRTIPLGTAPGYSYRIQALQNGTSVSVDGLQLYTLNARQHVEVNGSTAPVAITANKPISVVQYHEGYQCAVTGDPSMFSVLPAQVTTLGASFSTISSATAPQYSLSIVAPANAIGAIRLNGNVIATSSFAPFPGGTMMWATVPILPGTHRLTSTVPFQAYMVFRAQGDSYVYPASEAPYVPPSTLTARCISDPDTVLNSPIPLVSPVWTSATGNGILGFGSTLGSPLPVADTIILSGTLPVSNCPYTHTYVVGMDPASGDGFSITSDQGSTPVICTYSGVDLYTTPALDPAWFDIQWSPRTQVSNPHGARTRVYPTGDTWFHVTATSPTGCGSYRDSILVRVTPNDIFGFALNSDSVRICAGNSVALNALPERVIRNDRFESAPASWWTITGGSLSTACGATAGNALYFNGSGTRSASTSAMDLVTGGKLHFALRIGGGAAPCDDADAGEDVVVEYQPTTGSWIHLATLSTHDFAQFTSASIPIPVATATTRIRIRQPHHSGAGQDNWAIDDVIITRYETTGTAVNWTPSYGLNNSNGTRVQASPGSNTVYYAQINQGGTCPFSDSVRVFVDPAFHVTAPHDTLRCTNDSIPLVAAASETAGVRWSWSPSTALSDPNIRTPNAAPSSNTRYTVHATNTAGCTATDEVQITVGTVSSVVLTADRRTICRNGEAQLSAQVVSNGPHTIQWAPATGLSATDGLRITARPSTTTTYTCTVTDPLSGCTRSASITVEVAPERTLQLGADTILCSALGHVLRLDHDVPGNPTYSWNNSNWLDADNIRNPRITHDTSATWTVTVTDEHGCSTTASTRIDVAFDNLETPVTVHGCIGTPLVLDAEFPGSTYAWTTGENSRTITVDTAGAYTVTLTDTQFCQVVKTFHVVLRAVPVLALGDDRTICGAGQATLDAGTDDPVRWTPGNRTGRSLTITNSGSYVATATNAHGCTARDTVHIELMPLPVNALQDMSRCVSDPPTLDAGNPGSSYLWSNNSSDRTLTADSSGRYSVTVTTAAGCSATFAAQVVLAPEVALELGPDTALCVTPPYLLHAGPATYTYRWDNGSTTAQRSVSADGSYRVTASNGYCQATDSVRITFLPVPRAELRDITACITDSVTLDAGNPGSSYAWTHGPGTRTLHADSTGTYSVRITNAEGCSTLSSARVVLMPEVQVELGSDTVLCSAPPFVLATGLDQLQHRWSTGANSSSISVNTSGSYHVTVSNDYCSASDSIRISFAAVPVNTLRNITVCATDTATLDAGNPGSSYAWAHGPDSQQVAITAPGSYQVTITAPSGCTDRFSATVTHVPTISIDLGPDTALCTLPPFTLTAGPDSLSYVWNNGANGNTHTVRNSGSYSVVASNGYCTARDTVRVTFNPLPTNTLSDITTCIENDVELDAGNNGSTFLWNTGSTDAVLPIDRSGGYSVIVTTVDLCADTFHADVTLIPAISIELGKDTALCEGEALELTLADPDLRYTWSTGATSSAITVTHSGTYSVLASNGYCTARDTIAVVFHPLPHAILRDTTACAGDLLMLDAGNPGSSYQWNTGENTATITVDQAGSHSVTITTPYGCSATFSAVVTIVPYPVVDLGGDRTICANDLFRLDAGNPDATHSWNTGATTSSIQATEPGSYRVIVDNGFCVTRDSMQLTVRPIPEQPREREFIVCLAEEPFHVDLDAENPGASYAWEHGPENRIVRVDRYGIHPVTITNRFDCSIRAEFHVVEHCTHAIYVPNSFTPNGDGINDTWGPVGKNIATVEVEVFDRWGALVYYSTEIGAMWDGSHRAGVVTNDVFVWRIRYRPLDPTTGTAGFQRQMDGHLQVVR